MHKFFACLLVASSLATVPAYAADSAKPAATAAKVSRDDLIYRVNLGRSDDVKLLFSQGASANETDNAGAPILALAAARNDDEGLNIIITILDAGGDINKTDRRGQNALFYAAKSGNRKAAEYLISKGINYAAADKSGSNARTMAYNSNHNEIVELLDNHVRSKNDDVRKQYDEANQQLSQRYQAYNDAIEKQREQQAANPTAPAPDPSQNPNFIAISRIKQYAHDISFASCALAYWTLCTEARQPTEFGAEGLAQNMEAQRARAISTSQKFTNDYGVGVDVIQKIAFSSAAKIRNDLIGMQTNANRKEQGVGTMDDMNARCNGIANLFLQVEN